MVALKTSLLTLTLVLLATVAHAEALNIPKGTEITVDGKMGDGEWTDALQVDFIGGETLKIKQDGKYLYLYIRGETPGVASLAIHSQGLIQILHASAGLITARYLKEGERWRQVEPFRSEKQMAIRNQGTTWRLMAGVQPFSPEPSLPTSTPAWPRNTRSPWNSWRTVDHLCPSPSSKERPSNPLPMRLPVWRMTP